MKQEQQKTLHIQFDICSRPEGAHVHFHNKPHQHVSGNFHAHIIEAAYCQSHHLQQFEAVDSKK